MPTPYAAAMSALRLVCHVTAPGNDDLPNDDAHPFWIAIDELADAVADAARARGVDPDKMALMQESGSSNSSVVALRVQVIF